MCSINFASGYVEVSCHKDPFAHGYKIPYPRVQHINKVQAEAVPALIPVRWAVYANQDKCWEFKNDTSPFGIESGCIELKP